MLQLIFEYCTWYWMENWQGKLVTLQCFIRIQEVKNNKNTAEYHLQLVFVHQFEIPPRQKKHRVETATKRIKYSVNWHVAEKEKALVSHLQGDLTVLLKIYYSITLTHCYLFLMGNCIHSITDMKLQQKFTLFSGWTRLLRHFSSMVFPRAYWSSVLSIQWFR